MRKSPEEIFVREVPRSFSFLVSELGFKLSKKHDCLFEALSPQCIVLIGNDWPGFYVAIKPAEKSTGIEINVPTGQIGLSWIVNFLNPKLCYKEFNLNSVDQIPSELRRQSEMLKKYCYHFLKGDFSRWEKIANFVSGESMKPA